MPNIGQQEGLNAQLTFACPCRIYADKHQRCPECGVGIIPNQRRTDITHPLKDRDTNPAECPCGWAGIVDELTE